MSERASTGEDGCDDVGSGFLAGGVVSDALGTSSGHGGGQIGRGKLPDDGGRLLALLLVDQLVVALEGAHGLDLAPVDGFLVEFLAELELDGGVLEGGQRVERVLVALLDQLDRRVDAVAQLAEHHADTQSLHVLVEALGLVHLVLLANPGCHC